ncbi:MAG TPA: hypothetical protein VN739_04140 [Nitrososphaerales archaeon]|nr:hypothetical protein [Nitrososphaerales archaeon]
MKKDSESPYPVEGKTAKLADEIESWRSFAEALRSEDRQLLRRMLEKIWTCSDAVENCKEGYETEAFLLSLLISQQKTIDLLEKKKRELLRDA